MRALGICSNNESSNAGRSIMDFTLPPALEDVRLRTREFIEAHVLALEADRANFDDHENIRLDVLGRVRETAKAAGLWAPQTPKEFGGMGLPVVGWAAMYEEANRSIFGPVCFNCAAPYDGNMNLLARAGTADALHALAWPGQALLRDCAGLCGGARRIWDQACGPRKRSDQTWRCRASHFDRTAACHACGLAHRPR